MIGDISYVRTLLLYMSGLFYVSPLNADHASIIKRYFTCCEIILHTRNLSNNFILMVSGKRVRNINLWWDTCCICLMPHRDCKIIVIYPSTVLLLYLKHVLYFEKHCAFKLLVLNITFNYVKGMADFFSF